jgi:hypothetical protein
MIYKEILGQEGFGRAAQSFDIADYELLGEYRACSVSGRIVTGFPDGVG